MLEVLKQTYKIYLGMGKSKYLEGQICKIAKDGNEKSSPLSLRGPPSLQKQRSLFVSRGPESEKNFDPKTKSKYTFF